ncbi:MAG: hypothetical protein GY869_07650, partial [Planctomycetes bacterium]|nr:hypothetical protein [Planctomycetota bacterium]
MMLRAVQKTTVRLGGKIPVLALAILLMATTLLAAAELSFPRLSGRIVDNANLLSANAEKQLTALLKTHED